MNHARDFFFFFPLEEYIQGLFSQPDLVPHMYNDCGEAAPGGVRRSKGWRTKITDNPIMNQDNRNLAFAAGTDGVPMFKSGLMSMACLLKVCFPARWTEPFDEELPRRPTAGQLPCGQR